MIKLNFSMVKRSQSRNPKYNYSQISITTKLDQLGWSWYVKEPGIMILHIHKTFTDQESAIKGRKELEARLHPVGIKFDGFEHVEI